MRKVILLVQFILFHCCLLFGQDTKYVNANQLNLRQQPDKNGSVIQSLQKGTEVEVLEEYEEGWSKVSVAGIEGYVSSSYLVAYSPALGNATTQGQQKEAPHGISQRQNALCS
jgi:uncharacterized protein YgiM (DUF1202 family)